MSLFVLVFCRCLRKAVARDCGLLYLGNFINVLSVRIVHGYQCIVSVLITCLRLLLMSVTWQDCALWLQPVISYFTSKILHFIKAVFLRNNSHQMSTSLFWQNNENNYNWLIVFYCIYLKY